MTQQPRPQSPAASSGSAEAIPASSTYLGIELGSTRIKACMIGPDASILAAGTHSWENQLEDGIWTYSMESVWHGVQQAYAELAADALRRLGWRPATFGAIGISAMMHGYLALDAEAELLVPFRTWRNTSTGEAAAELTQLFGVNIPLRWSIAHLHQAVLDAEPHLESLDSLTTLAGYVHRRLTGERVLGIGDASGMFPIDAATGDYEASMIEAYDALGAQRQDAGRSPRRLRGILPRVLGAGERAGELTAEGAALLDPSGALAPGVALCPPEGDAGTGMVATNSVTPRTGNVSAGTSVFAMVVLEEPLAGVHEELDLVTTPAGDPVAMVHCNNGAGELAGWAGLFARFSAAVGNPLSRDDAFQVLFREALDGAPDADGLVVLNHLAGEPIAGFTEGRPLIVRGPESDLSLANFARSQLYGVFGTLSLGMEVLGREGVGMDRMFAHGGMFRTAGAAQRVLAAALDVPVAVGESAGEGGAWGMAVLAGYLEHSAQLKLDAYLAEHVFGATAPSVTDPDPADVAGFAAYLDRYRAALAVEAAAIEALPRRKDRS